MATPTRGNDSSPQLHWNLGYWVVAGLVVLWLQTVWQASRNVEAVPYSQFEQALAQGRVAEVIIGETTVTGRLKSPEANGKTMIVATRVEPALAERMEKYGVPYS